jgi:hypothetical protein
MVCRSRGGKQRSIPGLIEELVEFSKASRLTKAATDSIQIRRIVWRQRFASNGLEQVTIQKPIDVDCDEAAELMELFQWLKSRSPWRLKSGREGRA